MTRFQELVTRMATDPAFARAVQDGPDELAARYGLSDAEVATVLAMRVDTTATSPTRLEQRLSRSGGIFGGALAGAVESLAGGHLDPGDGGHSGDGGSGHGGSGDHGSKDSGSGDHGSKDSGPADHGPKNSGPADHGPKNSGPADHGPKDSGSGDHSPKDSGSGDHSPKDSGPADHSPEDGATRHVPDGGPSGTDGDGDGRGADHGPARPGHDSAAAPTATPPGADSTEQAGRPAGGQPAEGAGTDPGTSTPDPGASQEPEIVGGGPSGPDAGQQDAGRPDPGPVTLRNPPAGFDFGGTRTADLKAVPDASGGSWGGGGLGGGGSSGGLGNTWGGDGLGGGGSVDGSGAQGSVPTPSDVAQWGATGGPLQAGVDGAEAAADTVGRGVEGIGEGIAGLFRSATPDAPADAAAAPAPDGAGPAGPGHGSPETGSPQAGRDTGGAGSGVGAQPGEASGTGSRAPSDVTGDAQPHHAADAAVREISGNVQRLVSEAVQTAAVPGDASNTALGEAVGRAVAAGLHGVPADSGQPAPTHVTDLGRSAADGLRQAIRGDVTARSTVGPEPVGPQGAAAVPGGPDPAPSADAALAAGSGDGSAAPAGAGAPSTGTEPVGTPDPAQASGPTTYRSEHVPGVGTFVTINEGGESHRFEELQADGRTYYVAPDGQRTEVAQTDLPRELDPAFGQQNFSALGGQAARPFTIEADATGSRTIDIGEGDQHESYVRGADGTLERVAADGSRESFPFVYGDLGEAYDTATDGAGLVDLIAPDRAGEPYSIDAALDGSRTITLGEGPQAQTYVVENTLDNGSAVHRVGPDGARELVATATRGPGGVLDWSRVDGGAPGVVADQGAGATDSTAPATPATPYRFVGPDGLVHDATTPTTDPTTATPTPADPYRFVGPDGRLYQATPTTDPVPTADPAAPVAPDGQASGAWSFRLETGPQAAPGTADGSAPDPGAADAGAVWPDPDPANSGYHGGVAQQLWRWEPGATEQNGQLTYADGTSSDVKIALSPESTTGVPKWVETSTDADGKVTTTVVSVYDTDDRPYTVEFVNGAEHRDTTHPDGGTGTVSSRPGLFSHSEKSTDGDSNEVTYYDDTKDPLADGNVFKSTRYVDGEFVSAEVRPAAGGGFVADVSTLYGPTTTARIESYDALNGDGTLTRVFVLPDGDTEAFTFDADGKVVYHQSTFAADGEEPVWQPPGGSATADLETYWPWAYDMTRAREDAPPEPVTPGLPHANDALAGRIDPASSIEAEPTPVAPESLQVSESAQDALRGRFDGMQLKKL